MGLFVKSVLITLAAVSVAALAGFACTALLGFPLTTPFFLIAVVVATKYGGLPQGLLAVFLSYLVKTFFFLPPILSFRFGADFVPEVLFFVLLGLILSIVCALVRLGRLPEDENSR